MHKDFIDTLKQTLIHNQRNEAIKISLDWLSHNQLTDFFEMVIPSILNSIDCEEDDYQCIFLEHQMSSITRTLIEHTTQVVNKQKGKLSKPLKVLVACIKEETHELGALIGSLLLEYYGFETTFVGANTPIESIKHAVKQDFDLIVLSATNMYNLIAARETIKTIRASNKSLKVYGAGRGIGYHYDKLDLDGILSTKEDIVTLLKKEGITCSHLK